MKHFNRVRFFRNQRSYSRRKLAALTQKTVAVLPKEEIEIGHQKLAATFLQKLRQNYFYISETASIKKVANYWIIYDPHAVFRIDKDSNGDWVVKRYGISINTIQEIENGRSCRKQTKKIICKILNQKIDLVFPPSQRETTPLYLSK